MSVLPHARQTFETLPDAERARQEALQDVFGKQLFDLRTTVMELLEALVKTPEKREALGTIRSKPYEDVAAMSEKDLQSALVLARSAVHFYIQHLMAMLDDAGVHMKMGESHFLHYRLTAEVFRISDGAIVEERVVNRFPLPTLGGKYGKWLNITAQD